jgi:hypothetical protein
MFVVEPITISELPSIVDKPQELHSPHLEPFGRRTSQEKRRQGSTIIRKEKSHIPHHRRQMLMKFMNSMWALLPFDSSFRRMTIASKYCDKVSGITRGHKTHRGKSSAAIGNTDIRKCPVLTGISDSRALGELDQS